MYGFSICEPLYANIHIMHLILQRISQKKKKSKFTFNPNNDIDFTMIKR